jgi:hypothetical protein
MRRDNEVMFLVFADGVCSEGSDWNSSTLGSSLP